MDLEKILFVKKLLDRFIQQKGIEKENQVLTDFIEQFKPYEGLKPKELNKVKTNMYEQVTNRPYVNPRKISFRIGMSKWKAIAATVLFLILAGFGAYTYQNYYNVEKHITNKNISTETIVLPDGSKVYLNHATELVYNKKLFNREKREVWLKDGEAFFEVTHNPEKPFIVHFKESKTEVLGTSFNIKSYRSVEESVVTVRTGKVKVSDQSQVYGILTKNQRIDLPKITKTKSSSPKIVTQDAELAILWTKGFLTFVNAPYKEVVQKLKMKYGITMTFHTESNVNPLLNMRFNASFKETDSLEKVAEAIAGIYELNFHITDNQLIFYQP